MNGKCRRSPLLMFVIVFSHLLPGTLIPARGEGVGVDPPPIWYTVVIRGVSDSGLRKLLRSVSTVAADEDEPSPSEYLLGVIAADDAGKMEKVLRSRSYYSGTVRSRLESEDDKLRVVFIVDKGTAFPISSVSIGLTSPAFVGFALPDGSELGLGKGDPAAARAIIAAGAKLLDYFQKRGYPYAEIAARRVVVDFARQAVDITFTVAPGELVAFGETSISGLKDVEEAYIRRLIPWEKGRMYNSALIQQFRNRLGRTGLFTTVAVSLGEKDSSPKTPPSPVSLPILVKVRERFQHTFGLTGGYSSDLGFGGSVSWEDRNLFGRGEFFRLKLFGSEQLYTAEGRFRLGTFLHPDQSLELAAQPVYEDTDAYKSYRIRGSAVIEREFAESFTVSAGLALTQDSVEQLEQGKDFTLLSLPLNAQVRVGGEQPFRRAGALISLLGEPYYDLHDERFFFKILFTTNLLYHFPGASFLSAVGRVSFGSIPEASPGEVPADLRFYAGGSNSVRGYAYQSVGPLAGKDPVGGRSLFACSLEFDLEIIGDFGAAFFIDGGSSFADDLPDRWKDVLWGTGGGLRYFTPIGPIGLDIGFPLNKRKGIDDDFQVYVSIAQIF